MANREYKKWLEATAYDYRDKVKVINDYIVMMFNRSQSIFTYENLPDTINKAWLEYLLQSKGYALFMNVDEEDIITYPEDKKIDGGLYVFYGGLGGVRDFNGLPTFATITNARLKKSYQPKLGEEVVLVKNDAMMRGLLNIYRKYATMLTESDISLILADINARTQSIITAQTDNDRKMAIKYLEDLEAGVIGVIGGNMMYDAIKASPYNEKASESLTNLIEYHQYILAQYFNTIGINANFNMKREALNSGESALNDDALRPLIDDMLEERKKGIDEVNRVFGTDIKVGLNSSWRTEYLQSKMSVIDLMKEEPNEENTLIEDEIDDVEVVEEMDSAVDIEEEVVEDVGDETERSDDDDKRDLPEDE